MWIPLRIDFDLGAESVVSPTDTKAHGPMCIQGADFSASFNVAIAAPVDFSGRSWALNIYTGGSKTPLLTSVTGITGDASGNISITIPAAATPKPGTLIATRTMNGIGLMDCAYELVSTGSDGSINRIAEGAWVFSLAIGG